MKKLVLLLFLAGCGPTPIGPIGACEQYETCTTEADGSKRCDTFRIWYECEDEACEYEDMLGTHTPTEDQLTTCVECYEPACG